MVRKYNNLWEKIISIDNLELAFQRAKKGKSSYRAIQKFEENKDNNLNIIRESLINKTFKTSKYFSKTIYEPKERIIYILPFYPDRIVQHALINVLEPIFVNMFIKDSYACIKDRGLHKGSLRTTEYVRRNKYCLKCDIRKFYPSINQDILFNILKRKIKCKDTLWLIKDIIYSFDGGYNVPIGNLTSQWFGNLYMHELDKYVKEELKIKDYVRYCDDFCLFSNDKKELNICKNNVENFLKNTLDLKMSKCDLFQTNQGVDFLGYRHFKHCILLRKSTAKRVKKRIPRILNKYREKQISPESFRSTVESTLGWIDWANTNNFKESIHILEMRQYYGK